jgi:hypothetical protein
MTSNQVMQEMQAYKVAAQNAEDARAHAMGMQRSSNLALKASVVEREAPPQASIEARLEMCPKDMRHEYHEHMAFVGTPDYPSGIPDMHTIHDPMISVS